jgi:hypothetical protein
VTDPQRVDNRADIYSLGVVFYEMLTGELPGKRIEPPSRKVLIYVRLDEVVLRALETNPELRYQQVSEVKTYVETIATDPAVKAGASPPGPIVGSQTTAPNVKPRGWSLAATVGQAQMLPGDPRRRSRNRTAILLLTLLVTILWAIMLQKRRAVQADEAAAEQARLEEIALKNEARAADLSYGPVIECLLLDVREPGTNHAIRFRTGEMTSPPVGGRTVIPEWMLTNRIDLAVSRWSRQWSLVTAGLRLRSFPSSCWEEPRSTDVFDFFTRLPFWSQPADLEVADRAFLIPEDQKLPLTLGFKTLERQKGLLQITGFTENPSGVKIRYKLAKPSSEAIPDLKLDEPPDHP